MCPASKTKVYFGTEIDGAVARDGTRYGGLDNAFLYRKQLVANCTCNGRDAFGLAPFEMASDPTLRPGDIVVTKNGLMAYTGKPGQAGAFTPVDPASISAAIEFRHIPAAARSAHANSRPPSRRRRRAVIGSADPERARRSYLPPVVDLRNQDGR